MQGTFYPSAGVYIKEVDLSQRVANVASSIGAIVGSSERGPLMERTYVTSIDQFISLFGKPTPATSYMHYAAIEFIRESGRLFVTRVAKNDALSAGAYLSVDDAAALTPVLNLSNFGADGVVADADALAAVIDNNIHFSSVAYTGGHLLFTGAGTGTGSAITVPVGGVLYDEAGEAVGTVGTPTGGVNAVAATPCTIQVTLTNAEAALVRATSLRVNGVAISMVGVDLSGVTSGATLAAALAASSSFASVVYASGALTFVTSATGVAAMISVSGAGALLTTTGFGLGVDGAPLGASPAIAATAGTLEITISDVDAATVDGQDIVIGGNPMDVTGLNFTAISNGADLASRFAATPGFASVVYAGGKITFTTVAVGNAGVITITGAGALTATGVAVGTGTTIGGGSSLIAATPGTLAVIVSDTQAKFTRSIGVNINGVPASMTGVVLTNISGGASLAAALAASSSFSSVTYSGGTLHFTTTATGTAGAITITGGSALKAGALPVGSNGALMGATAAVPGTAGTVIVTLTDAEAATVREITLTVGGTPVNILLGTIGRVDPFNTLSFSENTAGIEHVLGFFCASNPGEWNDALTVRVRPSTKRGAAAPVDPTLFYVDVFLNYQSPSQVPDESWIVSMDFRVDGFGRQMNISEVINTAANRSKYIKFYANEFVTPGINILTTAQVTFEGGTGGGEVTGAMVIQGWDLYADAEQVDVNILINGGFTDADVQQHMAQLAQKRMDCVAVLDMPPDLQDTSSAYNYRRNDLGIDSSYAAIYSPDLLIRDPYNDIDILIPPSGHAAAIYARTDNVAELWFAPAGITRGFLEVKGVRHVYNQAVRDTFAEIQINSIRAIPGVGYFVWGADTLQTKASALSNINVRRLMNYLEKSIAVAALYSVFEPNDPILWMRLRDICDTFLKPIRAGRGVYWYETVCDDRNNPPESIAAGDVNLDVYVDPVIPAKRIHINAIINRTGVRFTEASR